MSKIGVIYILHFHRPLSHANHYIGWCEVGGLENRLRKHRNGSGARIMAALKERGIGFDLVRLKLGDRHEERRLKNFNKTRRMCFICRHERGWKP